MKTPIWRRADKPWLQRRHERPSVQRETEARKREATRPPAAPIEAPAPAPPPKPVVKPPTKPEFTEAAQARAMAMLDHLTGLAEGAKSEAVRVSAANAVIDRAYGRPAPGKAVVEDDDDGPERWEVRWVPE